MKSPSRILAVVTFCSLVHFGTFTGLSADLTPEQVASLKAKIKILKETLDGHLSSRNENAGDVFLNAASDPRSAVALYLKCYKTVHFDREELKESDFRAWKEGQADRIKGDGFVESLQMQLRFLGLSCRAAEVKDLDEIFAPMASYVDSLSRLEKMPDQILMNSVANSVFSQAYHLERLLGQNKSWEPIPFNIAGIYEKVIFPYLRAEDHEALMGAWDRRIEQQTRLVNFLDTQKKKELRGMSRDQERRQKQRQNNGGNKIMKAHDKDDFYRETLPNLQWSKLKDMYQYIDQLAGAKAMVSFIEANLQHPKGEEWFNDFQSVIDSTSEEKPTPVETPPSN